MAAAHGHRAAPAGEPIEKKTRKKKSIANATRNTCAGGSAGNVQAFGYTFTLAPGFSIRLSAENSLLLTAFAKEQGLAIFIDSELQPRTHAWSSMLRTLSADALRVYEEENAGGASSISEALSMEVLHRTFGARLCRTEMQLVYWPPNGAITDFSIRLGDTELGVSVTRAFGFAMPALQLTQAEGLLRKKLGGVLASNATNCEGWQKQILHIWCRAQADVEMLQQAYCALEPELVADTVVLVTLCCGLDELFSERCKPKKGQRYIKGLKDPQHLQVLLESDPVLGRRIHARPKGG